MEKAVKVSVNLSPDVVQALREVSSTAGVTITEAIRRAIGTEKFLMEEMRKGNRILIEDKKGGKMRQIVLR